MMIVPSYARIFAFLLYGENSVSMQNEPPPHKLNPQSVALDVSTGTLIRHTTFPPDGTLTSKGLLMFVPKTAVALPVPVKVQVPAVDGNVMPLMRILAVVVVMFAPLARLEKLKVVEYPESVNQSENVPAE